MTKDSVDEYLVRLSDTADENAFHGLIEGGEETVAALRNHLSREHSNDQLERFVEVLRELRIDSARQTLTKLCEKPYSKQWIIAAEGLFYNDPHAAIAILEEQQHNLPEAERKLKGNLIRELIDSMET